MVKITLLMVWRPTVKTHPTTMAAKSSRLGALKHARKEISSMVKGCATPLFVMAFLPVLFPTAGLIGTPYFFKDYLTM
jgi:hypothetical protein